MLRNSGLHIVTGATSGIGMAIARTLAASSRQVLALGRNEATLDQLQAEGDGKITCARLDLLDDAAVTRFGGSIAAGTEQVLSLVHCAGTHYVGDFHRAPVIELDDMYRSNVRARYTLTQALLPALERGKGYLILMDSSASLSFRAGAGAYSATQHAMRALAATWRLELNERGIRVLNIYPGRTLTPRIERLFAEEGRAFVPELLLQPEDIARVVLQALELPHHVELTEVSLRPATKSY